MGDHGTAVSGPFHWTPEGVQVDLEEWELDVLASVAGLLASIGPVGADPAADRLQPSPYPGDPQASAEYGRLMETEIVEGRRADRSAFELTVDQARDGVTLSDGEAEAWLRVIGEGRLALAARAGFEEEGWEAGARG